MAESATIRPIGNYASVVSIVDHRNTKRWGISRDKFVDSKSCIVFTEAASTISRLDMGNCISCIFKLSHATDGTTNIHWKMNLWMLVQCISRLKVSVTDITDIMVFLSMRCQRIMWIHEGCDFICCSRALSLLYQRSQISQCTGCSQLFTHSMHWEISWPFDHWFRENSVEYNHLSQQLHSRDINYIYVDLNFSRWTQKFLFLVYQRYYRYR